VVVVTYTGGSFASRRRPRKEKATSSTRFAAMGKKRAIYRVLYGQKDLTIFPSASLRAEDRREKKRRGKKGRGEYNAMAAPGGVAYRALHRECSCGGTEKGTSTGRFPNSSSCRGAPGGGKKDDLSLLKKRGGPKVSSLP